MPLDAPVFSIITPVYRTPLGYLEACIASVEAQTFRDWELLLIDNGNDGDLASWLNQRAASDPRLRVIRSDQNLGISEGSQLGVTAASGEFIALLDHDDTLSPVALSRMAAAIGSTPAADYLYSDEDKLVADSVYADPFFKPDWSPERFRHQMYTCHLSVLRTSLVREVGGFRPGFDGSQDYDLVLRVTERARAIAHVPEILYHWRAHAESTALESDLKPFAQTAAKRALEEHCERIGIDADVCDGPAPGVFRLRRHIVSDPLVSFLLPTGKSASIRGRPVAPLVLSFIDSVEATTTYRNFEYVISYDSDMDPAVLAEVECRCERPVKLVEYVRPEEGFNFATKVNMAAARSDGEYLIVLNDDLEIITPDWVEELIGHAQDPGVGAVGGMYYFEDETIQHAGVACAAGPYHLSYGLTRGTSVSGRHLQVARECLVLTGACLAVRRNAFFVVGGFTELLPRNFNDVDFCLKLNSYGLRNIWTPYVEMHHFESKSRDKTVHSFEADLLAKRWGRRLYTDPWYNPNLNGAWPTWDHFDDWDENGHSWPVLVTSTTQLDLPRYLEMNPDLAAEVERDPAWDVFAHFAHSGHREHRLQAVRHPRPEQDQNRFAHGVRHVPAAEDGFEPEGYLLANPDLYDIAAKDPNWDPYEHLVACGIEEGRFMYVHADDSGSAPSGERMPSLPTRTWPRSRVRSNRLNG
jgi:GT2 family glycosyltransferase